MIFLIKIKKFILMFYLISLSACATFTVEHFPRTEKWYDFLRSDEVQGIRYFEPTPILIVTSQNTNVAFIPNPNRGVAIRFNAWASKQKIKIDSEDGILTKIDSDVDTTSLTTGILTLLQTLGKAAIENIDDIAKVAALGEEVAGTITKREGIYLFEFDDKGNFSGLKQVLEGKIEEQQ